MARERATRRQGLPDKVKEALKKTPGISPEQLYRIAFKIGKKFVIPTAPLRRKLGIEAV
jgi:hypothetical protein